MFEEKKRRREIVWVGAGADLLAAIGRACRWVVQVAVFAVGVGVVLRAFGAELAWDNPAAWGVLALYAYITVYPVAIAMRLMVNVAERWQPRRLALGTAVIAAVVLGAAVVVGALQAGELSVFLFDMVAKVVDGVASERL